MNERMTQ